MRLADGRVTEAVSTGEKLTGVRLEGRETIGCDAIFLAPRPVPHDAILTELGAVADPTTGFVAVDSQGATNIPGVWAAGNVVNPRVQVVTAAGLGSVAAIAMAGWLLQRELSSAVSRRRL